MNALAPYYYIRPGNALASSGRPLNSLAYRNALDREYSYDGTHPVRQEAKIRAEMVPLYVETLKDAFIPGYGSGKDAADASEAFSEGRYGSAAISGGMAALDFVPVLGAAVGALRPAKSGIRAYHGSPHDFDKFSMDKIGTGEGAQAYGHGLYFAESEDVARLYRDAVSSMHAGKAADWADPKSVAEYWAHMNGGIEGGIEYLQKVRRHMEQTPSAYAPGELARNAESIAYLQGLDELPTSGRMYEVNINADPEDFLDWDAPLSEQPNALRAYLGEADLSHLPPNGRLRRTIEAHRGRDGDWQPEPGANIPEPTGNQIHSALTDYGNDAGRNAAMTRRMSEAGIPGIRYYDQGSRAGGEGTRNYVVFDENLIDILRKYSIGGLIAGGAYTLTEDEYARAAEVLGGGI